MSPPTNHGCVYPLDTPYYVWWRHSRYSIRHRVWWLWSCLCPPIVTVTYIAVRMTPVCALTVHTNYGVRYVPLIGGILKTSPIYNIDILHLYNNNFNIISLCYSLLLGINLWKGLLKKQPSTASSLYIMHIDLIRNVMHNIYYNGKPFHTYWYIYCIHLGHMIPHLRLYSVE